MILLGLAVGLILGALIGALVVDGLPTPIRRAKQDIDWLMTRTHEAMNKHVTGWRDW